MITTQKKEQCTIISFDGIFRFNTQFALEVKPQMMESLKNSSNLIVDLTGIKFIDSGGFGVIISLLKASKQSNSRLLFCNLSHEVLDLINIMQLHMILEIYSTLSDAEKSCM